MTPDQHTNQEFFLDVGEGHQLYVQDWGNNDAAKPIVYLHGGPGGGCSDGQKQQFDPTLHRVIFFDQRGSGRSTPYGEIAHNATDDLLSDITKLADHLSLSKFTLAGRSWGSCLALCYALQNPERVTALIIGGIYTGSPDELNDVLLANRLKAFAPEAWEAFSDQTPSEGQSDPIGYHSKLSLSDDPIIAKQSAYVYSNLIVNALRLDDRPFIQDFETFEYQSIKIESHYKLHNLFLEDNYVLENAHTLTMPVWIIQGRYDLLCPPETAFELHKQLPNSYLLWSVAGHTGSDRSTYDIAKSVFLGQL